MWKRLSMPFPPMRHTKTKLALLTGNGQTAGWHKKGRILFNQNHPWRIARTQWQAILSSATGSTNTATRLTNMALKRWARKTGNTSKTSKCTVVYKIQLSIWSTCSPSRTQTVVVTRLAIVFSTWQAYSPWWNSGRKLLTSSKIQNSLSSKTSTSAQIGSIWVSCSVWTMRMMRILDKRGPIWYGFGWQRLGIWHLSRVKIMETSKLVWSAL